MKEGIKMERAREELMKAIVFSKPTVSVLAMTGTVFGSSRKKTPKAANRNARREASRMAGQRWREEMYRLCKKKESILVSISWGGVC